MWWSLVSSLLENTMIMKKHLLWEHILGCAQTIRYFCMKGIGIFRGRFCNGLGHRAATLIFESV